jgi:hypothetical protein
MYVLYHPALFWLFGPYFCTKIYLKNVRPHLNILNDKNVQMGLLTRASEWSRAFFFPTPPPLK